MSAFSVYGRAKTTVVDPLILIAVTLKSSVCLPFVLLAGFHVGTSNEADHVCSSNAVADKHMFVELQAHESSSADTLEVKAAASMYRQEF